MSIGITEGSPVIRFQCPGCSATTSATGRRAGRKGTCYEDPEFLDLLEINDY